MIERLAIAGPDHRDFIGLPADMRKQFGDLRAALPAAIELPRTAAHRRFAEVDAIGLETLRQLARDGLPVAAGQHRLRIERVDMAHSPVHEEVDDALRARRLVRLARG